MRISKKRFGCLAVVLGLIVSQSALYAVYLQEDEKGEAEFAPDEIMIKLRPGPAAGRFLEKGELPGTLEELNRQFGVRKTGPVFTSVWEALKQEKIGFGQYVEGIRNKFPLRSARAPKGARIPDLSPWYKLELAEGTNVLAAVEEYKKDPHIEYAQPNYLYHTAGIPPDDPYYHSSGSWGQDYDDLWGLKKIECEEAWRTFDNEDEIGEGVIVAVVDTGIDYNHEDLTANVWQNLGEDADGDGHTLEYVREKWILDPGDINSVDDDDNGKTDDLIGWDFVFEFNDPWDRNGHGSHVSGTIAAVTDNGIGVSGVSWHSRIMPLRGIDDFEGGIDDLVDAIHYAADNGADVISNSWGPRDRRPSDPILEDAVRYAYGLGAVVVFSAGNQNDDVAFYSPKNMDEVIAVAATTQDDEKCSFSNWGEKIHVSAPGGGYPEEPKDGIHNILSTLPNGSSIHYSHPKLWVSDGYFRLAGTSMACPHVSGLAALLLSAHPAWANVSIMWHIGATADNIDSKNPGFEGLLGSGRINAEKALSLPPPPTEIGVESFKVDDGAGNGDGVADPGEEIDLKVYLRNVGETVQNVSADLTTDDPYVTIEKGHVTFAEIVYGERSEAVFRFLVEEDFPSNHDLVFQLTITHEGARVIEEIVVLAYWRELYVNWENTGQQNGTKEHPFKTIRIAIGQAEPYTEIRVARGTYDENIVIDKRNLHLYGGYDPTDWSRDIVTNETVIDGNEEDTVVSFPPLLESPNIVLSGFTIQNGKGREGGGGIYCSFSSPTITNNTISNNVARPPGGGGIYCYNSSPILTGNIIRDNSGYDGGGIYCDVYSSPTLTNNTIANNSSGDGGGMVCHDYSSPTLTNNTLAGNVAEAGGGIYCDAYSSPTLTKNTIVENSARYSGGGIYSVDSSPVMINNSIAGNSAGHGGGGFYSFDRRDPPPNPPSSPILINNSIVGNSAGYYGGGGIYSESHSPVITNNTIANNLADGEYADGGGIYCSNYSLVLTNNTITGNSVGNDGGGVYSYIYSSSSSLVTNNTIFDNSATRSGGGINCGSSTIITNSIIWANHAGSDPQISGSPTVTYSDVQGGWSGEGNINNKPRFVRGPDGDYYLSQIAAGQPKDSRCVDAGDPSSKPIDGTTRTDRVPDSGIVDMGYHYPAKQKNLVRNGGFERGERRWKLDGEVAGIDEKVAYKGKKSLRLDFIGGTQGGRKHAWQKNIEVVPGSTYKLAGFVMTDNLQGGAVQIQAVDQENGSRTFDVRTEEISGTVDWTKISAEFAVPEKTRLLKAIVRRTSTDVVGTAWFDNISLKKTSP